MLHTPSPSPLFVPSPPVYREVENETLTPVVMYKLVHGCVKLCNDTTHFIRTNILSQLKN